MRKEGDVSPGEEPSEDRIIDPRHMQTRDVTSARNLLAKEMGIEPSNLNADGTAALGPVYEVTEKGVRRIG